MTSKSTLPIVHHLLQSGFGVHPVSHKDLYAAMFDAPKTADAIECAFVRPVCLVERTAERGVRPDLWEALIEQVGAQDRGRVRAARVKLRLVIGVECVGLETPSEDLRVPMREVRRCVLRERIVLIERAATRRRQTKAHAEADQSAEEEEQADAISESDVADAPVRTLDGLPAFPPALLSSLTNNRERRGLHYLDGTMQCATIGNSTAFATTILAAQLIPPRDLEGQLLASYTHHIQPYFLSTTSLAYQLFAFGLKQRGPTRRFTHLDAVSAMPHQVHKSTMYTALKKAVIRPVFVVRELGKRRGNEEVWDQLTTRMGGFVPEEARLVVLLGLETVGLEDPRVGDRVRKPAERVYVVRERYALVV